MLCFKHWATSHYLAQDQRRIWANCYPDFRYRNCRVWYVEIKKKQREICHKQNTFYSTETKRMQRPIIWMLYTPHSLFTIFIVEVLTVSFSPWFLQLLERKKERNTTRRWVNLYIFNANLIHTKIIWEINYWAIVKANRVILQSLDKLKPTHVREK